MNRNEAKAWAASVLTKLEQKMPTAIEKAQHLTDNLPYTVKENAWAPGPFDGICWWTNGFWPAMMWQLYAQTGNPCYQKEARRSQQVLDAAFNDFEHLHHDVGFMWRISTGFDYELTGEPAARTTTLLAANLLAGRFNPNGFIRAWNADQTGWAIIDCMMNLSILYWASEQTGDPRFRLIAERHADTVQKVFIREDGTSEHIVVFDPLTGEVLDKLGGQGYEKGSVWSRGLSWALYGFTISYRHTQKPEYLETAKKTADAFIRYAKKDWLPDCDFRQPPEPVLKDDCAGGIAACGLLELADCLGEEGAVYYNAACHLLMAMEAAHTDWSEETPAILTHCTGSYHGKDHHIPMVYGDYYFVEGVCRLLGNRKLRW